MIRNPDKFAEWLPALFDGEFQWDFLSPCFKDTKIMPMDFDAVVERRGHTAIFETKENGKSIDTGQAITLTNEWKKGATIFHVQGKTPATIRAFRIYAEGKFQPDTKVGDWLPQKGDAC